jgi:outer membrane protein TolC
MVPKSKLFPGRFDCTAFAAFLTALLLLLSPDPTLAQEAPRPSINIAQAIDRAQSNFPSIRAAQAQKSAADAGVDFAKTAYVPRADLLWQENLATRNNVFGLLLPQSTIPSISGPGLASNSYQGAWGSAGGLLVSWEPFDFGLRKGGLGVARALSKQAQAGIEVTKLDAALAAADAFLTVLANDQVVRAAQANVDRFQVFSRTVGTLVANQLRPGVDVSRAEAELATARNQLIQAQQNAELARVTLAESLGEAGVSFALDPGPLLELPPPVPPPSPDFTAHPASLAQMAALEVVHAREHALDRSYFPRFNVQGAVFGRGSGALLSGGFDYSKGYYPDTANWATGITITFNVSDVFGIRARKKVEAGNAAAEQARYDQVLNTLKAQDARARALIEAARRMADNTPIQVKAAQETIERARVRYEYGLTNITEVADAQRLMTQAEIDDSVAKIAVWRALLAAARMSGELKGFLDQVANTPVRGKR